MPITLGSYPRFITGSTVSMSYVPARVGLVVGMTRRAMSLRAAPFACSASSLVLFVRNCIQVRTSYAERDATKMIDFKASRYGAVSKDVSANHALSIVEHPVATSRLGPGPKVTIAKLGSELGDRAISVNVALKTYLRWCGRSLFVGLLHNQSLP